MPMLWNRISVHYLHHFPSYVEDIGPILGTQSISVTVQLTEGPCVVWSMYPVERMSRYVLERMTSGAHQEQQVVGVVEALLANELLRFGEGIPYTIDSYHNRISSGKYGTLSNFHPVVSQADSHSCCLCTSRMKSFCA